MGMYVCTGLYIFILPFKSKSYHLQNSLSTFISLLWVFLLSCSFLGFKTAHWVTESLSNLNYASFMFHTE